MDWSLYNSRINARGANARERQISRSRYLFEKYLPSDPSYKENVEIINKGFINLRMNEYTLADDTTPQMEIQALLPSSVNDPTFVLGDVFRYSDGYWLCIQSENFHDIYRRGKVEECNYLLRWQDKDTLELKSCWSSIRRPYSSGVNDNKVISVGAGKYQIKMPQNSDTVKFCVDQRFLINLAGDRPIPYKIIDFDDVSSHYVSRNEGFLVIILQQCELTEDDNRELMIANYKDPSTAIIQPTGGNCLITYVGEPIIKSGGSAKTFRAVFKDSTGTEIPLSPIWELKLPSKILGKVTITESVDNFIRLAASDDKNIIGSNFILRLTADGGQYEYELTISIGGLLG